MSVTSTQTPGDGHARIAVGAYIDTGTAAAFTITCGFTPLYVKVFNEGGGPDGYEWNAAMADAEAWKTVAAGTVTFITTLGITPKTHGFQVGLDTDVNVTNQQISWLALG